MKHTYVVTFAVENGARAFILVNASSKKKAKKTFKYMVKGYEVIQVDLL